MCFSQNTAMSTIIYPSPVFGPIRSRRLGISLGINLLPSDGKICTFDCLYCECGFNSDRRTHSSFPTVDEVESALILRLNEMLSQGITPDVLTFAGNGEPTLHPQFGDVVRMVISVRNNLCPSARLSILSNATQIHRSEIRDALMLFDNNILKLDTASPYYISQVDRPTFPYDVGKLIDNLCLFGGKVIIQTMFMCGIYNGISVDNTSDDYVIPYLEALDRIRPLRVMIYTIDRETPAKELKKASPDILYSIADRIRSLGLDVSVSL